MNCPKCNKVVLPGDFYCKSCGKVLKIQCPRCGTVNKKPTCTQCNLKLLIKCVGCSQITAISATKCTNCKTSIVQSLDIRDAKIKEFALVSIEFSNINQLIELFGAQAFKDIKKALYKTVEMEAKKHDSRTDELRPGLVSVRFTKKRTFEDSCNAAMEFAVQLSKLLGKLNKKLEKAKETSLKVKIGVSIGNIFDRRVTAREERSISTNNDIDVIVNPKIYMTTRENYEYEQVMSVFVNNEMVTFYRLVPEEPGEDPNAKKMAQFKQLAERPIDWDKEQEHEDLPKVGFSDKKYNSIDCPHNKLQQTIVELLEKSKNGALINVVGDNKSGKLNNVSLSKLRSTFQNHKFVDVCCTEHIKFYPFGLFRTVIRTYLGLNEIEPDKNQEQYFIRSKLSGILSSDRSELESLLSLESTARKNIDEIRYKLFEQIKNFFMAVSSKGDFVFLIEDFENIDRGSLDCFKYLVDNEIFSKKVTFILSTSSNFYLSKQFFKLNSFDNYYEIKLKHNTVEEIVGYIRSKSKDAKKNYLFKKIVENSRGSIFYIDQALHYLVENEILKPLSGALEVVSKKTVFIPNSVEEIIKRRIERLLFNQKVSDLFVKMVLLGPSISLNLMKSVDNADSEVTLKILQKMDLVDLSNKQNILIKNYNLVRNGVLKSLEKERLIKIAQEICTKFNITVDVAHPVAVDCLEFSGQIKEACDLLNRLSHLFLLVGDVSAFIECSDKFLAVIDDTFDEKGESEFGYKRQEVNKIRLEIYEQIGKLCFEYYPEVAFDHLKTVIEQAEREQNEEKIIKLSTIIVQACNLIGNYIDALEYIGKIISRTDKGAFKVNSATFSPKFYLLNFIKIQSLFNLGRLDECIILAEEALPVFKTIKDSNMLADELSPKLVENTVRDTGLFLVKAKILQMRPDAEQEIQNFSMIAGNNPTLIEALRLANKVIKGVNPEVKSGINRLLSNKSHNKDTMMFLAVLSICCNMQTGDLQHAANTAYSVRSIAEEYKDYQTLCFFDLAVGQAYKAIGNLAKAREIYQDVLKTSAEKNIMNVMFMSWYLISSLEYAEGNVEFAIDLMDKANMVVEQNQKSSKFFSMFLKTLLAKMLNKHGDLEKAKECAETALNIATANGLIYNQVVCSKILSEILGKLQTIEQNPEKLASYKESIQKLSADVSMLMPQLSNPTLTGV